MNGWDATAANSLTKRIWARMPVASTTVVLKSTMRANARCGKRLLTELGYTKGGMPKWAII
jgi:hypothetical protein